MLSAFVRVHSDPLYQYKATLPDDAPPESAAAQRRVATEYAEGVDRPPVDVQAAVTVLGRLPTRTGPQPVADLTGAWLNNARLAKANLTGADLREANMTGALLARANLTGALLGGANLTRAILREANLTEAYLAGADLTGTHFSRANLTRAILVEADLTGADLREARNLVQEQVDSAKGDDNTILPAALTRPQHWPPPRPQHVPPDG